MLVLNSPQVVQETVLRWKRENRIAFVPTMGCLHEGHLRLIRRAKQYGQKCIVSVFVNPLQFGPNEDFEKYPRPFEQDADLCENEGVDLLFHPSPKELYPDGFCTKVSVGCLTSELCGRSRPGHFEGVATVVLKLFQIAQPDFAIFGEKDFQQLAVIQRMTADLNLPVTILPHPTVREADGIALSSRNRYLSPTEREWARRIPQSIELAREVAGRSGAKVRDVLDTVHCHLTSAPLVIDYVAVASELDLAPKGADVVMSDIAGARLFIAVKAGSTRLIDNGSLAPGASGEPG